MNGPVAVVACRLDWTVEWANVAAVRLLGTDPSGRPLADFVKADANGGDAAKSSLRQFERQDGDPFWAFTAQSETPHGHVLQIFEADDYVREREKLAYQESIFRHAIEAAEHAVWDYNANNEALFYSDAWKAMRGFPLDEEIPRFQRSFGKPACIRTISKACASMSGSPTAARSTTSASSTASGVLDGRWIWILARGRSVEWDENGRPTRLIGTDIDITKLKDEEARRAAEAELAYQQHLAELETANRATEAARQAAYALARQDPLSSLANRRGFAEEIERLSNDGMAAPAFAVLLIDLDRFKPINDMHGHAVGDLVIKESAQRLAARCASDGMVARLGGDEFGVVLIGA